MMRPFSFRLLVPFAVIILVAACSSDDGASEGTATQSERTAAMFQADVEGAADSLVDQWGSDRDAFFVVAWSLDAGYSAAQILAAAPDGRIRADGTITGPPGGVPVPDYEPAGLLKPLEGEAVGFGPVIAVAAAGLGDALRRLADEAPSDAEVTAIGRLQEVFDAGLAAFEEQAKSDARVTLLVTSLAARGYSVKQIAEGLVLDQWDSEYNQGIACFYLTSGEWDDDIVRPVHPPADIVIELTCPPVPDDATTEVASYTTSSTTARSGAESSADVDEDDTIDVTYVGSVSVAGEHSENATVLDSQVTISIADGIANVEIDMTTEIVWVRFDDDTEPCISTDHWTLSGSGTASSPLSIELAADSLDLIAISGCERDEEDEDDAFDTLPLEATIADGSINGSFFNGLFLIAATRT